MIWNLLTDTANNSGNGAQTWILMAILLVVIVVMMVFNRRSQKKREEETKSMLDAIRPGNKVKTIGGICGIVVEVCPEDNTFVLETGTENSGKSYIKFDKQAVYQTDAVAKKEEPAAPEAKADAPAKEVENEPVQETAEEQKDAE